MKIRTHFNIFNAVQRRQERRMFSPNLMHESNSDWWVLKYTISYLGVDKVEAQLQLAVQQNWLVLENRVHHGKRGIHVHNLFYFWYPEEKFALRFTRFVNSSPHYLEITGDITAARKFLSRIGI